MDEPVIVELEGGGYLVQAVEGLDAEGAGRVAMEAAGAPAIEGLRVASVEGGVWMVQADDEAPAGFGGDPYWVICDADEPGAVSAWKVVIDFENAVA